MGNGERESSTLSLNLSKLPKWSSRRSRSMGPGAVASLVMHRQKKLWFHASPAWFSNDALDWRKRSQREPSTVSAFFLFSLLLDVKRRGGEAPYQWQLLLSILPKIVPVSPCLTIEEMIHEGGTRITNEFLKFSSFLLGGGIYKISKAKLGCCYLQWAY